MDKNAIMEAARERLYDAALEDLVRAGAGECRVHGPNARVRWLAAAVILFGGLVTVGVAWLQMQESGARAQDPRAFDPIFPAVEEELPFSKPLEVVASVAELESLPDTVDSLVLSPAAEDLVRAAARPGIKTLWLLRGDNVFLRLSREEWQRIGEMPDLESLTVGIKATADDLRELRRAPNLHTLFLAGTVHVLDAKVATALVELPKLSSLFLGLVDARSEGIATLRGTPTLEALYIEKCDFEPDWVEALGRLRMLRWLFVHATGKFDLNGPRYRLTADDARHLAKLERLSSLTFGRIEVADEVMGALPRSLEVLRLRDEQPLSVAGLRQLASLPRLRGLTLGALTSDGEAALVQLMDKLPLERFGYRGRMTDDLWQAVVRMPHLRRLELMRPSAIAEDLERCAKLPKLEWLELTLRRIPTVDELRVLAVAPVLREVVVYDSSGDGRPDEETLTELQGCLGPAVRVVLR